MASLQAYQSHHIRYWRIVESYRKDNGKPALRVLAHLGRVDDILELHRGADAAPVKVSSVSAGAVTALYGLAQELDLPGRIDRAVARGGVVQTRDGLSVGKSLLAAIIARACAPRSKRAFAEWAKSTYLPELMDFKAAALTSQHFWDQMQALPVAKLAELEQQLVSEVVRREQLKLRALAYDTTNFYTHIATTNARPQLPQRGHNKQRRHDLRQLGLALIVDQATRYPLGHVLYEGARSDMRTFAEFLKPLRRHLAQLSAEAEQLTLVFDAGASSKLNLASVEHFVTAVRHSDHRALVLPRPQSRRGAHAVVAGEAGSFPYSPSASAVAASRVSDWPSRRAASTAGPVKSGAAASTARMAGWSAVCGTRPMRMRCASAAPKRRAARSYWRSATARTARASSG